VTAPWGAAGAPEVTVVIPTRDRWGLLAATLRSVLAQERVALEVVVVDDASATRPPTGLLDDARVRVLRGAGRGVACARNLGVEAAQAPWLAFVDDDDLWAPAKLRTQLDAAGGAGLVCAGVVHFDEAGPLHVVQPAPSAALRDALFAFNPVPGGCSNAIAATDAVRAAGGFDAGLSLLADWDLWLKLGERGAVASVPDVLVGYRVHAASMSSTRSDAVAELRRMQRAHAAALRREGRRFDARGLIDWSAEGRGDAATPAPRCARTSPRWRWRAIRARRPPW
jgi:glycosyltransferase involved in cell wall biosynthesis